MTLVEARGASKLSDGSFSRCIGVVGHGYQPPRECSLPDGTLMQVVPDVNERIHKACYRPVLINTARIPAGFTFSLYGTLREWMKGALPQDFVTLIGNVNEMPDKEYQVLGDPYLHVIMPLLPDADQDMLLKLGKSAFREDLGFDPKGLWLPETAISYRTLRAARHNEYEFVALRDSQILSTVDNPMYVGFSDGGSIAVMHFDKGLSGEISFQHWAIENADNFLATWEGGAREVTVIGSDIELFGHHQDAVGWLKYLLQPETLAVHGFRALSNKEELTRNGRIRKYTAIYEHSSWSCDHGLGRWTGECGCDKASWETQVAKRSLFSQLSEANRVINQDLSMVDPEWRDEFILAFLNLRGKIFTGQDFLGGLERMISREKFGLFSAKLYTLIGLTSCGWFFGESDSPTREIPVTMVRVVNKLLEERQTPGSIDKAGQFAVL